MSISPYDFHLDKTPANYQPLTPTVFLERAALVYPEHTAIIHGAQRVSYRDFYARARRLASALIARGIGPGDTVSVMLANTPSMLEAHYGVPMTGAVLHSINTRLDAPIIAFMLDHAETKLLIVDTEFSTLMKQALAQASVKPQIIAYEDVESDVEGEPIGTEDYETVLASGDPDYAWEPPSDEWNAISLNYTSGTTGNPKGVVYTHRGATLMCYANTIATGMQTHPVYLWTLPMFHCNGWCFPWSLSLVSGTHVCLRAVRATSIYDAIAVHKVSHLSGAPFVMSVLLNAKDDERRDFDHVVAFNHAAAPPPAAVLGAMADAGFHLTHLYGLTETYGPATLNEWHEDWDRLPAAERLAKRIRQGVRYHALEDLTVKDPKTMQTVPADGETLGEVMFRGNIVMKGYLKNREATEEAFAGGWFHSGDLGVLHEDGYIQLKDRSKDIIISGGENISSIEVEDVLYKHPAIAGVAVVAKQDDKWGETPCAFIEVKPGTDVTQAEIIAYCRDKLAHFKCPRHIVFTELPRTSTGKIQKYKLRAIADAE
jgi:3-(methylthio)propionyl---CoA ligase